MAATAAILNTLATADMAPDTLHTPIGHGITHPARTMVGGIDAIVKHEHAGKPDRAAAERMVYVFATVSDGLAIVPPTVVRRCADGHTVSVAAWHAGSHGWDMTRRALRSDIVGAAILDMLTGAGADRHEQNWLLDATHADCAVGCAVHHSRAVMIDGGRAFRRWVPRGIMVAAMSGLLIPQYAHAHLDRIIAAAPTLRDEAFRAGLPVADIDTALTVADTLRRSERFPILREAF